MQPTLGRIKRWPNCIRAHVLVLAGCLLLVMLVSACAAGVTTEQKGGGAVTPSPTEVSTPVPAAATAKPAPAGATAPTLVPTPTAAPIAECRTRPVRSFGKIYGENPNVARSLGCPTEAEKQVYSAEQFFQRGYMLWRSDTRQIYAIMNTGRWVVYPDTYTEGEPSPASTATPPAGTTEPVRGFGKVWRQQGDVRDGLGWATERERGFDAVMQPFEKGTMLWSDRRFVFVLFSDGTWLRFEDTFRG